MIKWTHDIALVALALMAVLVMVFLFRMEGRLNSMKVMRYQLQSLRMSVNLFKVVEGRSPSSMVELASAKYSYPGEDESRRFVDNLFIDSNGRVMDPFGNPYVLDAQSGWVRSQTRGYEFW